MKPMPDKHKAILAVAFAKIDPVALAVAWGSVSGLLLFIATAVLLVTAAPPGTEPGPHLGLIAVYLPGYSVSWPGAVLGAAYLSVIGALTGFILGVLWNLTHHLYVAVHLARTVWRDIAP